MSLDPEPTIEYMCSSLWPARLLTLGFVPDEHARLFFAYHGWLVGAWSSAWGEASFQLTGAMVGFGGIVIIYLPPEHGYQAAQRLVDFTKAGHVDREAAQGLALLRRQLKELTPLASWHGYLCE